MYPGWTPSEYPLHNPYRNLCYSYVSDDRKTPISSPFDDPSYLELASMVEEICDDVPPPPYPSLITALKQNILCVWGTSGVFDMQDTMGDYADAARDWPHPSSGILYIKIHHGLVWLIIINQGPAKPLVWFFIDENRIDDIRRPRARGQ